MMTKVTFDADGTLYCEQMNNKETDVYPFASKNRLMKIAGIAVPIINVEYHTYTGFFTRYKKTPREEVLTNYITLCNASNASQNQHMKEFRKTNGIYDLPPKDPVLREIYDRKGHFFNEVNLDICEGAKPFPTRTLGKDVSTLDAVYEKRTFESIIHRLEDPVAYMPRALKSTPEFTKSYIERLFKATLPLTPPLVAPITPPLPKKT
ncbi:MAG: hypothetical protein ACOYL1_06320 [Chlamydiia bacterium]